MKELFFKFLILFHKKAGKSRISIFHSNPRKVTTKTENEFENQQSRRTKSESESGKQTVEL